MMIFFLFNSYYNNVGKRVLRPLRGLIDLLLPKFIIIENMLLMLWSPFKDESQ
jgi:hypothetical protein